VSAVLAAHAQRDWARRRAGPHTDRRGGSAAAAPRAACIAQRVSGALRSATRCGCASPS